MGKKANKETTFEDKLPLAIQTGKVHFGFKQSLKSLVNTTCKMIVISSNLPANKRKQLEYYAYLNNNIPIYSYVGSNNNLARSCSKFFRIGVVSIIEDGQAELIPKEMN